MRMDELSTATGQDDFVDAILTTDISCNSFGQIFRLRIDNSNDGIDFRVIIDRRSNQISIMTVFNDDICNGITAWRLGILSAAITAFVTRETPTSLLPKISDMPSIAP